MAFTRNDTTFLSAETICRAWHYRPVALAQKPNPCIVMAHGLGGTRDARLEPYAEFFARAGYDVLLFDYRHFGASDGQPRQLLSISRQLADWAAAIKHARSMPYIDPTKVALWGSSFSGGHVIVAAARDGKIAAVSAQGPMMDGMAAVRNVIDYAGLGTVLRLTGLGILDLVMQFLGRKPVYIPLVAEPGEIAAMSTPDAYQGYLDLAPPGFRNEMTARLSLELGFYRPIAYASRLPCAALIQVCSDDSVAPPEAAIETARRGGENIQLEIYEGMKHFDIYVDEGFRRSSSDQLAFFNRVLLENQRV
jgi:uncharacterized protein